MGMDTTLWGAFIAGIASFLSPCILPIIPPYLCFITGLSLEQITDKSRPGATAARVFASALAFVLGFSTIFILLGASATYLGQKLTDYFDILKYPAGAIIIVMGLHFLGIFKINLLYRQAKVDVDKKPPGLVGAFLVGLAFAFGWTPCVGPVLSAILFVAGTEESAAEGARLLAAYSAGIGIPFLLAAIFAGAFLTFLKKFSSHMATVEKVMGAMLVITGVLIMTGYMQELGFFLQRMLPGLSTG